MIFSAGLEPQLQNQLNFGIPAAQFVELLVSILKSYGRLGDGRDALEAILEAAKQYVGKDRQAYGDTLIQALHDHKQPSTPPQPPDRPVEPPADVSDEPSVDVASLRDAYLNRLLETCGQVFLSGIDKKAAGQGVDTCLQLSAIYTALFTLSAKREQILSRKGAKAVSFSEEAGVDRLSALQQLNKHKRLVLLGDPGSGKSTFINFVALCLAGQLLDDPFANLASLTAPLPTEKAEEKAQAQSWDHGALVPVRIILRDFAARGLPPAQQRASAKHLWQFLTQELEDEALERYTPYLREYLRTHGGVVLFDGLDEVPEAEQRRTQIKQVVESFARAFPKCRIVVTSRTYAYQQQEWRLSGFREAVLAPFAQEQIQEFIERWYRHGAEVRGMNPENARGQAELLKQAILKSKRLYSLAERPLLLTLMASLHYWRGGSLPEKREELYNDTVDLLLDWWERPKVVRGADGKVIVAQNSLTELLNVGKDRVRNLLNYLAFQAHSSQADLVGTADITEQTLKTELMNISQNPDLRPQRLLEYLSNRAGLLVPRGVGIYTFPHRTFQEYLSACYLTDQDDYPENVAELGRQHPDRCREVVLLAGARVSRNSAPQIWWLAEALCYQDIPGVADVSFLTHPSPSQEGIASEPLAVQEDAWGALLAGQALAETANLEQISPRNQSKANRIRQWLVAILTERAPQSATAEPFSAVERAQAGDLLAVFGDERCGVGLKNGLPDIEWCEVPEGTFLMGSELELVEAEWEEIQPELQGPDWNDALRKIYKQIFFSEHPQHTVALSTYHISRYPITNVQYRVFIDDGGYTEKWKQCWMPEGWQWREENNITEPDWVGGAFDLSNHPVVRLSWYEAVAFCAWLTERLRGTHPSSSQEGKTPPLPPSRGELLLRLPTEAEWEYAARGPEGRKFPWKGTEITPEQANYKATNLSATSAVGCFPGGQAWCDAEEMAGNVWEWCRDWFQSEYYAKSPDRNPQGPESGEELLAGGPVRVRRGGSWYNPTGGVRGAYRHWGWPHRRSDGFGFRPVRIYH